MDQSIKHDSFFKRRLLFKDIWEKTMEIEENKDIPNKSRIIKTVRLEQSNKLAEKRQKQRIKNLRHVCNKLLDFCDKHDADISYGDQMQADEHDPDQTQHRSVGKPPKKRKRHKTKTNVKKAKNLFSHKQVKEIEKRDIQIQIKMTTSNKTNPKVIKVKPIRRKHGAAGSTSARSQSPVRRSLQKEVRKRTSRSEGLFLEIL